MDILFLLIVLSTFHNRSAMSHTSVDAIKTILLENFAKDSKVIDIVHCESKQKNYDEFVNNILRIENLPASIQVSKYRGHEKIVFSLDNPSVLIFDSLRIFKEAVKRISWQHNPRVRYNHLVYIAKTHQKDIIRFIDDGFKADQVNFLTNENENSIDLMSVFMFTEKACRVKQFVKINSFSKVTLEWESLEFFPDKYQNFHSCTLLVM